jgi:hypothetical protein
LPGGIPQKKASGSTKTAGLRNAVLRLPSKRKIEEKENTLRKRSTI